MIDEFPVTWEEIVDDNDITVLRLRVPGGWLVTIRDQSLAVDYSTTIFVPNPEHLWGLSSS